MSCPDRVVSEYMSKNSSLASHTIVDVKLSPLAKIAILDVTYRAKPIVKAWRTRYGAFDFADRGSNWTAVPS